MMTVDPKNNCTLKEVPNVPKEECEITNGKSCKENVLLDKTNKHQSKSLEEYDIPKHKFCLGDD